MLVYEKWIEENDELVRHLFGTMNTVPAVSDNQLIYKDVDGDVIETIPEDAVFLDDGHGGINMVDSDGNVTFLGVNIKKANNEVINIIPGGDYTPMEKVLTSIRFKHKPNKTAYIEGEEIDTTGIKIEATFVSGDKEDVTTDCEFTPEGALATTDEAITASYTYDGVTKTATYAITVVEKQLTGIAVKTPPTKTAYTTSETLDMTGLVLTASYDNNTTEDINYGTTGITYDPAEGTEITADTTVTITYGGKTTTQAVIEKTLESIAVKTPPTKVAYTNNETLDMTGLVLTATYDNGDTEDIAYGTSGITYDPAEGTTITENTTVTITYEEKTTTQAVTFS